MAFKPPLFDTSGGEEVVPLGFVPPAVTELLKTVCVEPFRLILTVKVIVRETPIANVEEAAFNKF